MNTELTELIKGKSEEYLQYMIDLRRDFHRHPELGFEEFRTSQAVKDELDKMGIEWISMAGTGVVGLIHGKKASDGLGKVVLLRADMDALPVQEDSGVDYASEYPGKMHACGHDGHTAALLGSARILNDLREYFSGTVKLMFQPSEEAIPGAERMVKEGVLENPKVDYAIAHHISGGIPKGFAAVKPGGFMAADDWLEFTINGIGAHGSTPQKGDNVIAMASRAILDIYENLDKKLGSPDGEAPRAVSICAVNGGNNHNVLPGSITAMGTIRSYDQDTRKKICDIIEESISGVVRSGNELAAATGRKQAVSYDLKIDSMTPPTMNDGYVTDIVRNAAVVQLGKDRVIELEKGFPGSEDFSFVTEKVPSCYFMVGIAESETDRPVHHAANFRWDDSVLGVSAEVTVRSALSILG